jgi:hypothetical protein
MTHIKPCELLLPKKLSNATKKMLSYFTNTSYVTLLLAQSKFPRSELTSRVRAGTSTSTEGTRTRIEEFPKLLEYSDAFDFLTEFYNAESKKGVPDVSEAFKSGILVYLVDCQDIILNTLCRQVDGHNCRPSQDRCHCFSAHHQVLDRV